MRNRFAAALLAVLSLGVVPAFAGELEVGIYGGMNENNDSEGTLCNAADLCVDSDFGWDGISFQAPIYYGAKITYWPDQLQNWGFGLDFTHAKAYGDLDAYGAGDDYSVLEFTDGLNLLIANAYYRWDLGSGLTPYVGAGLGVDIPHVEITTEPTTIVGDSETFEYQLAGPAAQAIVGASYEFLPKTKVFAEYKLSYAKVNAQLDDDAGTFSTDIVSHHILAGLSYSFDFAGF